MANKVLKILMVEEELDDVNLIKRALQKAGVLFDARVVDSEETFRTELRDFSPDVILSDHSLPGFNSIEALKICQKQDLKIPFILVTGSVSEEFASISLKSGIADYVFKSELARLPSVISRALNEIDLPKK
jgi:DNA-binding NtrC family response regulator